jgi:hypothetical protein
MGYSIEVSFNILKNTSVAETKNIIMNATHILSLKGIIA